MKVPTHKLIIEDEVPLMITYKFDLLGRLIVCSFINIITGEDIPNYRPYLGSTSRLENSQYRYGIRILDQHILELNLPPKHESEFHTNISCRQKVLK